jgi:thioredoxin-like negative regulator of GroEL
MPDHTLLELRPVPAACLLAALSFAWPAGAKACDGEPVTAVMTAEVRELTYAEAYHSAIQQHRPLLVLVGAKWCPPCQAMERDVPAWRRQGVLKGVVLGLLDLDAEPALGRALTDGGALPQVILYEEPWRVGPWRRAIGYRTVEQVRTFVGPAKAKAGDCPDRKGS